MAEEVNNGWSAATTQLFEAAHGWNEAKLLEALSNEADVKAVDKVRRSCHKA